MFLYLVQHAEALSKEEDPLRGLSEKGFSDINKVAAFLSGLNIEVTRIYHSGKKRALQTAEVLAGQIKVNNEVAESDGLAPMDEPDVWYERILGMNENIMLAGHLPNMAKLASLILCRSRENVIVHFAMGCVVCLKRSDTRDWAIEWIIKPEMIN